jgi:hypothetical protein
VTVSFFAALFSFFNGGRFISRNEQCPSIAETWLAEIVLSDQSPCSLYRRVLHRHHKGYIAQLERIFRVLFGGILFGDLSKLLQAVHQ